MKSMSKPAVVRAVLYASGLVVLVGVSACAAGPSEATTAPTASFDAQTRQFAPCPDSPNCVSTQATDEEHGIAPYTFDGAAADAKTALLTALNAMPRMQIVSETDDYLHVEFRSRIFRFVDDVEFYIDDATKTVEFRSASRLGYSDLGVNRKRMEEIRSRFNSAL